jgi:hypothetical protein
VYVVVVQIAVRSIAAEDCTGSTGTDRRVQRCTTTRTSVLSVCDRCRVTRCGNINGGGVAARRSDDIGKALFQITGGPNVCDCRACTRSGSTAVAHTGSKVGYSVECGIRAR